MTVKLKNVLAILLCLMLTPMAPTITLAKGLDPYEPICAAAWDDTNYAEETINTLLGGWHSPGRTMISVSQKINEWVCYKEMNFTDAPYGVSVRVGVGKDYLFNNKIEFRIDDPVSAPIATIYVEGIDDWGNNSEFIGQITENITGTHDVYISSSQPNNFYSFTFLANKKGELVYTPYDNDGKFVDMTENEFRREVEILNGLGIIAGYDEERFMPDLPVTRGEFANWMAHFITDEVPETEIIPFIDIPDYAYVNEISYLYNKGIVSRGADYKFNPETFITAREGAAMLLRFMGYEIFINADGWPYEYDKYAREAGLIKNLTPDEVLNRASAAQLLYNAIDADFMCLDIEAGYNAYVKKKGVLEKTRRLFKAKGIVTATNFTSMTGDINVPDDSCYIGKELFSLDLGVKVEHYLGVECEYYYELTNYDDKKLLYITPSKKARIATIDSKKNEINKITNNLIRYTDAEGAEKKLQINSNASWIYNYRVLNVDIQSVTSPSNFAGTIRVVDNGNGWETVYVEDYQNIKIESYSAISNVLRDALSQDQWNFSDVTVIISDGEETVKPKNLKTNQLLQMYMSHDRKFVLLLLGESQITGKVEGIYDNKVIIDGTYYRLADEFQDTLVLGSEYDFCLGRGGDIVYIKPTTSASDKSGFGVLTNVREVDMNTEITIVVGTEEKKTFKAAKKIYVDGIRMRTYSEISAQLNAAVINTPVLYKLNANGELVMLDSEKTGNNGERDKLTIVENNQSTRYMYKPTISLVHVENANSNPVAPIPVKQNTVVITGRQYPVSGIDYSFASINAMSSGFYNSGYKFYAFEKNTRLVDLVFTTSIETYKYPGPAIFKNYRIAIDEYDNIGIVVAVVTTTGNDAEYFVPEENTTLVNRIKVLKKGDIISPVFGYFGELTSFWTNAYADGSAIRGGVSANVHDTNGFTTDANWTSTQVYGRVTRIEDDFVILKPYGSNDEIWMNIVGKQILMVESDGEIHKSMPSNCINVGNVLYAYNENAWKTIIVFER